MNSANPDAETNNQTDAETNAEENTQSDAKPADAKLADAKPADVKSKEMQLDTRVETQVSPIQELDTQKSGSQESGSMELQPYAPDSIMGHEIIGFDLGHGESALTLAKVAATTEPQVLDIQPSASFPTAVAEHPQRGVIIGEDAFTARDLTTLQLAFKSEVLSNPERRKAIQSFVSKVVDLLDEQKLILGNNKSHFVVGCPSGWSQKTREAYKFLLHDAGLKNLDIIAESRAAFIHAKESNEIRLSSDHLNQAVLIIDLGSSTTDFTAVSGFLERELNVGDFGENNLGAGLIDKLIFQESLANTPRKAELEEVFTKYPQYAAICELKCRQMKELYFRSESRWGSKNGKSDPDFLIEDAVRIPTKDTIFFEIALSRASMDALLARPLQDLKDQMQNTRIDNQLGWKDSFTAALEAAKVDLQSEIPKLIFLTGGASRMGFVPELCKEVFPNADVLRGKEPELAIAKGLAWAGRIDKKTRAFEQDIENYIDSGDLEGIVRSHIDGLLRGVARAFVSTLPDAVVMPAFKAWQTGKIKTLSDLEKEVEKRSEAYLLSDKGQEALRPAVKEWFENLSPDIEAQIHPLCDKYGLPRTAFKLSTEETFNAHMPKDLSHVNPEQLWQVESISNITSLIIAIVIARIAGGGGIALLVHGPMGWIAGLIAGTILSIVGRKVAERWAKGAEIPTWARALASGSGVKRRLLENREELEDKIVATFKEDPESISRISSDVSDSIQLQMAEVIEDVVLLIR